MPLCAQRRIINWVIAVAAIVLFAGCISDAVRAEATAAQVSSSLQTTPGDRMIATGKSTDRFQVAGAEEVVITGFICTVWVTNKVCHYVANHPKEVCEMVRKCVKWVKENTQQPQPSAQERCIAACHGNQACMQRCER